MHPTLEELTTMKHGETLKREGSDKWDNWRSQVDEIQNPVSIALEANWANPLVARIGKAKDARTHYFRKSAD